jgi:hypothetical protein
MTANVAGSPVIIETTTDRSWLSHTYLVADRPGGRAVVIDSGGPPAPILVRIAELRLELSHVLCTHHHRDHVAHNADYRSRFGCPICGHARESELFGGLDLELGDGAELTTGGLHIRAIHVPGHTLGQLAFLVNDERVFTGDALFRRSVGGTPAARGDDRAPGARGADDDRRRVGGQPVRSRLARSGPAGRAPLYRSRPTRGIVATDEGLRRRDQVLGALRRGEQAGHRAGFGGAPRGPLSRRPAAHGVRRTAGPRGGNGGTPEGPGRGDVI